MTDDSLENKRDFRDFFSKNSEKYSKSDSHRTGKDLHILVEALSPLNGRKCLDIATGTGFTAIELARNGGKVTAVDATEEMLEEARKNASEAGVIGIRFMNGYAETIDLGEEQFDVITCRRAAHHFRNKDVFLKNAFRSLKKGGKIGIVDMVVRETDASDILNAIERIRDPSHVRAERVTSWVSMLSENGFTAIDVRESEESFTIERWMYPVASDGREISAVKSYLSGISDQSLRDAGIDPENFEVRKKRAVITAIK